MKLEIPRRLGMQQQCAAMIEMRERLNNIRIDTSVVLDKHASEMRYIIKRCDDEIAALDILIGPPTAAFARVESEIAGAIAAEFQNAEAENVKA